MKNVQRHRGTSEKWRKYPLIPTVAVSTDGRVKNIITGRIYALDKNNHGRDTGNVSLRLRLKDANGVIKWHDVARMVALTFIGEPIEGDVIVHTNGITTDNRLINIEYMNASELMSARREIYDRPVEKKTNLIGFIDPERLTLTPFFDDYVEPLNIDDDTDFNPFTGEYDGGLE